MKPLEKKIHELQKEINLYLENWFNENNKQSELFQLLWWRNFLMYATWLTEKERIDKLYESNVQFSHIYIKNPIV